MKKQHENSLGVETPREGFQMRQQRIALPLNVVWKEEMKLI